MVYANLTAYAGLCYDLNISNIGIPILCLLLKLCEGSLTALVPTPGPCSTCLPGHAALQPTALVSGNLLNRERFC